MTNEKSPEELRKEANAILKGVDQLIKAGNLDGALKDIARAKAIDPRNAYIYAFEERISVLREEIEKKEGAASARAQQEEEARKKLEEARQRMSEERKAKEAEAKKRLEEEKKKAQAAPPAAAPSPKPAPAAHPPRKKAEEEARKDFEDEFRKASEQKKAQADAVPSSKDPRMMYKRVLLLVWADGAVNKEEEAQLKEMREAFAITPEEHAELEREARLESYAHAFKLAWTGGQSTKERAVVISELRKKFLLSPTEQNSVESRILVELGPSNDHNTIVIIEDEDAIRQMIMNVLEDSGFAVRAFATSDEAYVSLKSTTPDLIISDVNLETSAMGGFSFYEKVRELDHLVRVPFIFLSGMTDEGMVRYGKVIGADDYLTKPFSNDMLVDTVKGKLKRYRMLKGK